MPGHGIPGQATGAVAFQSLEYLFQGLCADVGFKAQQS